MTDGVWWFFLFWLPKYLAQYSMKTTDCFPSRGALQQHDHGRGHWWWLVPKLFHLTRFQPLRWSHESYAHHRLHSARSFVGTTFRLSQLLGAGPLNRHWHVGASSVVSQYFHDGVGYVPETMQSHRWWGLAVMAGGLGGVLDHQNGGWLFDYFGQQGTTSNRLHHHVCDLRNRLYRGMV